MCPVPDTWWQEIVTTFLLMPSLSSWTHFREWHVCSAQVTEQAEVAARRLLEVTAQSSEVEIRASYRRLLLRTHPDLSPKVDATERTMALTKAYLLLSSQTSSSDPLPHPKPAPTAAETDPRAERVRIDLLDDLTISVGAPASETLMLLIDMAHSLGEISYLDPAAGLLEIVIEFLEEPTSSVLLSMQGRGDGTTEVFCSVEPLSGGISPPADAVARLLLRTLTHPEEL
ncbi:MAG: DnaJ domain-containing protein [Actinobacteria bacterium]|nr:DnaJ domain-containing protein [Actinomycetota bacterium]